MNILVAGGAGYIGSHICKLLSQKGFEVIVLDNLTHGYKNFARWGQFIHGDIGDRALLDEIFKDHKIDAVMHFSAFIEVGESVANPEKYYANNLANSLTLLKAMHLADVRKFIFSSTAAVYGMPDKIPIDENDPKKPINPYGRSKWMIEQILEDYRKSYDIRSICFRYFNAAGADEEGQIGEAHHPESHLIPLIFDAALGTREEIKIFGTDYETPDGSAVRDYVHVSDLAKAHVSGLENLLNGGDSEAFNLGSGKGYSVKEVIDMVKKVTGRNFKVTETGRRPGDPPYLIASSEKARKILGWCPEKNLEEIVQSAWKWHQHYRKNGIL